MSSAAQPGRRLGVVATRCYPDLGGIESHLDQVVPRLAAAGWDIEVVVTDRTGRLPRTGSLHGVPVRRHRAFPAGRDYYLSPGQFLAVLRGRYDVVHVHGVNTFAPPVAMLAAALSRTPYAVTFHSGGANTALRGRLRSTQWRLLGPLLRRADRLIAVSGSESATFGRVVGDRPITLAPNGSSGLTVPPGTAVDPDLIVSIGRLERYKGHHLAIAALSHVRRTRPGARLLILGTGPYRDELGRLAEQAGVRDAVTIGSVPPEDRTEMARRLGSAAVVTLLSDYEAHPVSVLEAVSLGRPVLVRRNSGMVDLIERDLVDWVPDDADPAKIAGGLSTAMSSPPRPVPQLPTWDDCAADVHRVLSELVADRVGGR